MEHNNFSDISTFHNWEYVEQIKTGFSKDLKYFVRTKNSEKFFLRISEIEMFTRKKEECNVMDLVLKSGVSTSELKDFGTCNNKKSIYMLQTWVEGESLEKVLPSLSKNEQYRLGVEAGKKLKEIHSIKPTVEADWYRVRLEQYYDSYKKFKQYDMQYEFENQINDYIFNNVQILQGKDISLVHGDYHMGNMILTPEHEIYIIDFDRFDWKAPIEDFYKLAVFSRNVSIPFCRGQIDGYTEKTPSKDFWETYSLCIAMTSFLSLLWGKMHSEEMYAHRKKLCDTLVNDHHCFKRIIPIWYK